MHFGLQREEVKKYFFDTAIKAICPHDENVMDYMFEFYVAGVEAIIRKWVLNNCSDEIEKVVHAIEVCVHKL